jgi:hypothetical protein
MQAELLLELIKSLPPEKIAEVEDFIEFLCYQAARQSRPVDAEQRAAELQAVAASMKTNTFSSDPPSLTRKELHERR